MEVYSIEELHNLIVNKEIDLNKYYEELFEEAALQQERLNAFVTITKDEALKNIKELDVKEDELLKGIPAVFKDNYNTKGIKTTASSKMLEDYVPAIQFVNQLVFVELLDLSQHGEESHVLELFLMHQV